LQNANLLYIENNIKKIDTVPGTFMKKREGRSTFRVMAKPGSGLFKEETKNSVPGPNPDPHCGHSLLRIRIGNLWTQL
jgi:hypothetical protein